MTTSALPAHAAHPAEVTGWPCLQSPAAHSHELGHHVSGRAPGAWPAERPHSARRSAAAARPAIWQGQGSASPGDRRALNMARRDRVPRTRQLASSMAAPRTPEGSGARPAAPASRNSSSSSRSSSTAALAATYAPASRPSTCVQCHELRFTFISTAALDRHVRVRQPALHLPPPSAAAVSSQAVPG